jgi:GAF domain-containing protein
VETNLSLPWLITTNLLSIVSFIIAFYVLLLNPKEQVNRMTSAFILILAFTNLSVSLLLRATTYTEIKTPYTLYLIFGPAIGPLLVLETITLLKPSWLMGRMNWLRILFILLACLPLVITLIDLVFKTNVYLMLPDPKTYNGGFIVNTQTQTRITAQPLIQTILIYINVILIGLLIYFLILDRSFERTTRRIAFLLIGTQLVAIIIAIGFKNILPPGASIIITGAIFTLVYAYATFQRMGLSHSLQSGRLQTRLTLLTMVISVPLFIFISFFLIGQAGDMLENKAITTLRDYTDFTSISVSNWLSSNAKILQNTASHLGIMGMDEKQQKDILMSLKSLYPYMFLVSTTDISGVNIARSDDEQLMDYHNSNWFNKAILGTPVTFETLIDPVSSRPIMVVSVPIKNSNDQIIGVLMASCYLTSINEQVLSLKAGETGFAYIVDEKNRLIAHPNLQPGLKEFIDYSGSAPIIAMRAGQKPPISFTDDYGVIWRAYYNNLGNGWGIVYEQEEAEVGQATLEMTRISWGLVSAGAVILFALVFVTIRQAVRPINSLTETVKAITSGILDRVAPVESDDEIGTLARAFNVMSAQQKDLINNLERRVAERTLDLEHRSAQLQAAADVGHASATIRKVDELLPLVTQLISDRFSFYHVGIFMMDENKEYAVLKATNSEGGKRMLARGHRLKVGQQGIVGYVTSKQEPRIALNVGEDAVFFNNPDLPETQSEMALPLMVGEELLGALDVQSTQTAAFTDQDARTLRVLADQVAIALNSARLLEQTQQLLDAERRAYGKITRDVWMDQYRSLVNLGYTRNPVGIQSIRDISDSPTRELLWDGQAVVDGTDQSMLYVPVRIRNQTIGILKLQQTDEVGQWEAEDIKLMETLAEQISLALESARSYEETQGRAEKERVLANISSKVRSSTDVNEILQTAVQELAQAFKVSNGVIQLRNLNGEKSSDGHKVNLTDPSSNGGNSDG